MMPAMKKLLVLAVCLAFPATADAHHHRHHHHHKAHKAQVETPECWEVGDALECNAAEEAELARIVEVPGPVEEAKVLTDETEWLGFPEA